MRCVFTYIFATASSTSSTTSPYSTTVTREGQCSLWHTVHTVQMIRSSELDASRNSNPKLAQGFPSSQRHTSWFADTTPRQPPHAPQRQRCPMRPRSSFIHQHLSRPTDETPSESQRHVARRRSWNVNHNLNPAPRVPVPERRFGS